VGFVVDKVAFEQVSLWVLRLSSVNIIRPWLTTLMWWTIGPLMLAVQRRHSLPPLTWTSRKFLETSELNTIFLNIEWLIVSENVAYKIKINCANGV
jgi:hypothetical protein